MALDIIKRKEHLTSEGINKLLSIKASMNTGLSERAASFSTLVIPVERSKINQEIKDPNWIVGFVDGDGSFSVNIIKAPRCVLGETIQLRFQITQHVRDKVLLKSFISYLGCGIYVGKDKDKG
jgi:hypothetical protein